MSKPQSLSSLEPAVESVAPFPFDWMLTVFWLSCLTVQTEPLRRAQRKKLK
jgi:hypothetical protein